MSNITVLCTYKRNNGFDARYVDRLFRAVEKHSPPHIRVQFVCLNETKSMNPIDSLKGAWIDKGYWIKINLFKEVYEHPVIYFDLDTVIVGRLDPLFQMAWQLDGYDFVMLRPFNEAREGEGASGIMMWNGGWWNRIYADFEPQHCREYRMDQKYITDRVLNSNDSNRLLFLQDNVKGIFSYKKHCQKGLPAEARVVCFHGIPRPHEVQDEWVQEHWTNL